MRNAHVVCRDLGYSSASASYRSAHFGQGSGPIWVNLALCDGTENSLVHCFRLPWGCHASYCTHSKDAGVRCEGDRSDNAVNESVTSGLDYRINRYTYYNVSSELTFTPTKADNEGVLQCRLIGSERSRTLEVQHPPADNIILIKIVDNEDGQETDGLRIMCHVDPRDEPFPPIETYEIAVNDVIESASNSPSLILESIPRECVEISCTGINDIGRTNTTKTYCPRSDDQAPPARNILSIETQEINEEGNQVILVITCHVSPEDQPAPHLHTYTIGVDNTTLSSSNSPSTLFRPRPHKKCINVTCSGTNGIGWTYTSLEYCLERDPTACLHRGVLQKLSTTYALLLTAFFISMTTYAIAVMKRKKIIIF
ncbi:uncharacterized protein [Diadema setosum]|uniref:uncharacterized protein n=1 Tax=Diadema setosum TaxID=31175 RepID=UPI003B3A792E